MLQIPPQNLVTIYNRVGKRTKDRRRPSSFDGGLSKPLRTLLLN
jgi:hypothetical protein